MFVTYGKIADNKMPYLNNIKRKRSLLAKKKRLTGLDPGVNFINIFCAPSAPTFLRQKNYKAKTKLEKSCAKLRKASQSFAKLRKASQSTFV